MPKSKILNKKLAAHPFVKYDHVAPGTYNERYDYDFQITEFARALAKALGGEDASTEGHASGYVEIDGLRLYMSGESGAKMGRVSIGASIPAEDSLRYEQRSKVDGITLDAARPLDKIAADVRRKLIEPLDAQRAKGAATVKAEAERKQAFRDHLDSLRAAFPGLSIADPHHDHYEASFHCDSKVFGAYVNGRISSSSIRFEHMSVSESQFMAILGALRDNHPGA